MNTIKEVKKLWDDRPCNIRHSKKVICTKEYFDEVEKKKFFVESHINSLVMILIGKIRKYWRLDVVLYCSAGINFARSGAGYTGIELSDVTLNIAKKSLEVYNQKRQFYLGNSKELSMFLPSTKYDLVYSFGVIHHSPYPQRILYEIKSYMHENSLLKIMVYAKNSWKNAMIKTAVLSF